MTTLMQAHHQWASRPADERFTSLTELHEHTRRQHDSSKALRLANRDLIARPVEDDPSHRALVITHRKTEEPTDPTHWAFGQLCQRIGAPAAYLRNLPAPMAADCLNFGLQTRDVEDLGAMARLNDAGAMPDLVAVTGPGYGRIWNDQVTGALTRRFGDGITGDWRVPGEFGRDVTVTKQNTTLYAGDRDLWVFLCDERNRIEVPNRRNGQPGSLARGFFVSNSEVGASSLVVATFLFDYVCSNRMIWGAEGFKEVRIRHTSGAPDRWLEQVRPALQRYADASSQSITDAIAEGQRSKIGDADRVDNFLKARFTSSQAKAIKLAHEVEEQRPIETLWDVVTGATAYARSIEYQDERVKVERIAGDVLATAARKAA